MDDFLETLQALPASLLIALLAISLLGLAMSVRSAWLALLARRLRRHERELEGAVDSLQSALLPRVPERIGNVQLSVAYRPADGPAAGGDFHDVLTLGDGKVAIIVGDISGHGREALTQTAVVHYTVRAYLEAGLRPRQALALADQALSGKLGSSYATVAAGIYDPASSSLTYATAGHPAPLLSGGQWDHAVHGLSPPIGIGPRAGCRETRVSVPAGSRICFFTDGLTDARRADGTKLDREGLTTLLNRSDERLDARGVLDRLGEAASSSDDVTLCLVEPFKASGDGAVIDLLEIAPPVHEKGLAAFLTSCGVAASEIDAILVDIRLRFESHDRAVLWLDRSPIETSWELAGNARLRRLPRRGAPSGTDQGRLAAVNR